MTVDGIARPQADEGVHLPRRRRGAQAGHPIQALQRWCWTCFPGEAVQGDAGCVMRDFIQIYRFAYSTSQVAGPRRASSSSLASSRTLSPTLTRRTSTLRNSTSGASSSSRPRYVALLRYEDELPLTLNLSQKTRRRTYRAHGRINPYQGHPCHVEIILSATDSEVERAKDKDVVAASSLSGLNRRQVARRRIEAARAPTATA